MKLAIATGMKELDEDVKEMLSTRIDIVANIVSDKEIFEKQKFDVVVISKMFAGDIKISELFFNLKCMDTRIVYISDKNADEVKTCFSYQISDILFYPAKGEDIVSLVLRPNSFSDVSGIYLKYSNVEDKKVVEKVVEKPVEKVIEKIVEKPVIVKETVYKTKILKQKIFTFYTTDNALLTADLITQMGVLLSQKVEQKILILDFNTLFPVMDHFLGINKNIDIESKYDVGDNTSLVSMYNAIERNIFNSNNFSKFVKKHPKYKNIDVATGFYDLVLFEKMPNEYFEKIMDAAASIYDTILINTNPDISLGSTFIPLTKATEIICVSEANYTELRNLLFVMNNLKAKIPQDKFKIVMSNVTSSSLDEETIKKILEGYEILTFIPYDEARESSLNEQKIFADTFSSKRLTPYLEIMGKLDYIPKTSFWNKVFRSKREDKELVKGGKPLE